MDENKLHEKLDGIKSNADHSIWALIFFILLFSMGNNQQDYNKLIKDELVKTNHRLEMILSKMDTIHIKGVPYVR